MKRPSFSSDTIAMIVIAVAVIASIAYWIVTFEKTPFANTEGGGPQDTKEYARMDEFPIPTAQNRSEVEQKLLEAFIAGQLIEVNRFPIPGTSGQEIIFASPSMSGRVEEVECGIQEHSLCALYLIETTRPPRLLLWGSRMSGFLGIERFPDAGHAVISTAWTLYNFTSIERQVLNIATGELQPGLIIEIDRTDDSVEMRASGFGDVITLSVRGERGGMGIIPQEIVVRNQAGQTTDLVSADRVFAYASLVRESNVRLEALAIEAVDINSDELLIPFSLYGDPKVLDLQKGLIRSADAVSR
jgi:hypothetical protein